MPSGGSPWSRNQADTVVLSALARALTAVYSAGVSHSVTTRLRLSARGSFGRPGRLGFGMVVSLISESSWRNGGDYDEPAVVRAGDRARPVREHRRIRRGAGSRPSPCRAGRPAPRAPRRSAAARGPGRVRRSRLGSVFRLGIAGIGAAADRLPVEQVEHRPEILAREPDHRTLPRILAADRSTRAFNRIGLVVVQRA